MRRLFVVLLTVISASAAFTSAAAASPPSSPVTIVTSIDFSQEPFSGTFVVPEGANKLGCSAGTFEDFPRPSGWIEKHFTCTRGSGSGDRFIVLFRPDPELPGPGDANGPWRVLRGRGDFAGLRGRGDFSVIFFPPTLRGMETLTGRIRYN
jgi:hypothetical protein